MNNREALAVLKRFVKWTNDEEREKVLEALDVVEGLIYTMNDIKALIRIFNDMGD